jgi:hypothetical protein
MLKSGPVICLILVTLSANFGISLFTTCLPSYMAEVLDFDIKSVRINFSSKKIQKKL